VVEVDVLVAGVEDEVVGGALVEDEREVDVATVEEVVVLEADPPPPPQPASTARRTAAASTRPGTRDHSGTRHGEDMG